MKPMLKYIQYKQTGIENLKVFLIKLFIQNIYDFISIFIKNSKVEKN